MHAQRQLRLLVATIALGALAACSNADFNSKDKTETKAKLVAAACDAEGHYPDSGRVTTSDESIYLEGDFCPTAPAELRVVFLVDFSLSMHNKAEDRGNDKVVGGTCGRLKAAKAILARHRQQLQESGARMLVSVIGFSSGIDLTIPLTDIDEFESKENVDTFCVGKGNTNYKAAFDAASDMLKEDAGTKVVYFVSDGLPSMGGGGASGEHERHREAAEEAAEDFRNAVSKMTLNAVYLGNELASESDVDPEAFLAKITGDKARVKLVDNPDALAEQILDLEEPVIELDVASVKGVLEVDGVKTDVEVPVFEKLEDRKHVWRFYTRDIEPFKGGATSATLTVYATDQKDEKYQVVFTIQKP